MTNLKYFCFLFLVILQAVTAFSVQSASRIQAMTNEKNLQFSNTRLQYRDSDVDDDGIVAVSAIAAIPTTRDTPSYLELPAKRSQYRESNLETKMMDTEMMMGRIAMVAALVLFANEIATGQSLVQQIFGV